MCILYVYISTYIIHIYIYTLRDDGNSSYFEIFFVILGVSPFSYFCQMLFTFVLISIHIEPKSNKLVKNKASA